MRWASFFVVRVRAMPLLKPQRHHRVDGAEQDQCKRKRYVHQQPGVQPAMQLFLATKLARFLANIFQVVERGVRRGGQQSTQLRKGAACRCRICYTLSALSRMFEKWAHLVQIKTSEWRTFFLIQANEL